MTLLPNAVTTVADARAGLSRTLRVFRQHPRSEAVILGSHRKAEAALVPIGVYARLSQQGGGEPVLAVLRRKRQLIARLASLSNIESVSVFGSVARGDESATSDIDLLVTPAHGASLFDLAQFGSDVELLMDRPVDVVSAKGIDALSAAGRGILAEAVLL